MSAAPIAPRYQLSNGSSVTLDLLRAVSAQVVVVGHLISGLRLAPALQPPHLAPMQNAAVVVFFLLSGFLISYVVVTRRDQKGYGFRSYFIDRFSRIYTGFLPAIGLVFVLDSIQIAVAGPEGYAHAGALNLRTAVGNVLMLQDYPFLTSLNGLIASAAPVAMTSFGSGRTFWTIAIEWWIYLGFGWMILASPLRSQRSWLYWLVLAPLSIVPIWNLVGGRGNGLTLVWLAGGAVYLVISRGSLTGMRVGSALLAALTLLALAFVRVMVTVEAYDAVFALLLAGSLCFVIVGMDAGRVSYPVAARRWIRVAADYSFTLFLTHLSVYELVARWIAVAEIDLPRWLAFAVIFVTANILAFGVGFVTETRHRRLAQLLKSRFLSTPRVREAAHSR